MVQSISLAMVSYRSVLWPHAVLTALVTSLRICRCPERDSWPPHALLCAEARRVCCMPSAPEPPDLADMLQVFLNGGNTVLLSGTSVPFQQKLREFGSTFRWTVVSFDHPSQALRDACLKVAVARRCNNTCIVLAGRRHCMAHRLRQPRSQLVPHSQQPNLRQAENWFSAWVLGQVVTYQFG